MDQSWTDETPADRMATPLFATNNKRFANSRKSDQDKNRLNFLQENISGKPLLHKRMYNTQIYLSSVVTYFGSC